MTTLLDNKGYNALVKALDTSILSEDFKREVRILAQAAMSESYWRGRQAENSRSTVTLDGLEGY